MQAACRSDESVSKASVVFRRASTSASRWAVASNVNHPRKDSTTKSLITIFLQSPPHRSSSTTTRSVTNINLKNLSLLLFQTHSLNYTGAPLFIPSRRPRQKAKARDRRPRQEAKARERRPRQEAKEAKAVGQATATQRAPPAGEKEAKPRQPRERHRRGRRGGEGQYRVGLVETGAASVESPLEVARFLLHLSILNSTPEALRFKENTFRKDMQG